jgi:hypothetical protein
MDPWEAATMARVNLGLLRDDQDQFFPNCLDNRRIRVPGEPPRPCPHFVPDDGDGKDWIDQRPHCTHPQAVPWSDNNTTMAKSGFAAFRPDNCPLCPGRQGMWGD